MIKLKEGNKAPGFTGIDQDGNIITLDQFKGNLVILFFYSGDGVSGSITEACDLRDNYPYWTESGFKIIGVSVDSPESHRNFIRKYAIPFPLIADTDRKIIDKYGVWGINRQDADQKEGVMYTTFIISRGGFIEKVITDVNVSAHSKQIEHLLK